MVAPFLYKKWDPEAAFTRKQSIMSGGCQCIIIQMLKSPKFLSCQDLSLSAVLAVKELAMQSGQPQTRQRLLYIFIFFISYTWLQAFELGALKYQATRARMRREGITGEMWSVRMSTERLLTSLHVHSLMDIVQPAWLFPVFLPLSSPGCTLLPITAHACHPNPCEAECEVTWATW